MTAPDDQQPATFGYLLVLEDEHTGFTGGLLTVCDRGRPLEFHCTEPVTPSRAQEILFGPTLRNYVCGELIGGALLAKAKLPIGLLLTTDHETAEAGKSRGIDTLVLDQRGDGPHELLTHLASAVDPEEPFGRVREAIREAQRLVMGADDRAAA